MKKNIYLAILALALSLIAVPGHAGDCAKSTTLNLVVGKYSLQLVETDPVCLQLPLPATFTIKIAVRGHVPEMGKVSVGLKEKDAVHVATISGEYLLDASEIAVRVEGDDVKVGDEFDYFINVEGIGLIDPRIRIIP